MRDYAAADPISSSSSSFRIWSTKAESSSEQDWEKPNVEVSDNLGLLRTLTVSKLDR